jgi:hypothetical protein
MNKTSIGFEHCYYNFNGPSPCIHPKNEENGTSTRTKKIFQTSRASRSIPQVVDEHKEEAKEDTDKNKRQGRKVSSTLSLLG